MSITTTNRTEIETFARVNCSKIASSLAAAASATTAEASNPTVSDPTCLFPCKTCGLNFPSFQALGGHRASHKKPKPTICTDSASPVPEKTPKRHACQICKKEFVSGQALGGHKRLHKKANPPASAVAVDGSSTVTADERSSENSEGNDCDLKKRKNDGAMSEDHFSGRKRNFLDLDLGLNTFRSKYESEIEEDDEKDFLKLELRQPINNW